jgi:tricorn protease
MLSGRIILSTLLCLLSFHLFGQGTQLLREPTLSSDAVVFVHANDLWKVGREGGQAIRLTSNEGYESLPHFSPDEQWIAFTAQYDGNTDVYVIPATGGSPRRLTYHPSGDHVQGWTPEGKVLFRSAREAYPGRINRFYEIGLSETHPRAIDIPRIAYGEMSADGKYMAYIPITSWDPEWRNYRGGQAMPVWVVNIETKELMRAPQKDRERHLDPVWYQGKVYYLSERDYLSNIWSFDPESGEEKQHTFLKVFDIKSLDAGPDGIVYEQGGYLHLLDPESGETRQLDITVSGDMNFARTRWEDINGSMLSHARLSPRGQRAVFEHRGDIFTFPRKEGSWRNLTRSSGVADRYPVWSPQGDQIAWFSDQSGEYQLVVADQYGENPRSYPLENPTFYFEPDWSPDGRHIAYTDTDYNIWIVNLGSGKVRLVDTDRYAHPNRAMNPVWSPDSRWVAYARQLDSHFKAVFAYNIENGKKIQLTDGMADAISPVWDQYGKYLYFLASTNYGLNSGWLDMSSYDPQVTRQLFCIVLQEGDAAPILPQSDEAQAATPAEQEKKDTTDSKVLVNITESGLDERIVGLKLKEKNYVALRSAPANTVFVLEAVPYAEGFTVHHYDVKKQKAEVYAEGVSDVQVSSNAEHVLHSKGGNWSISAAQGKPKPEDKISTSAKIKITPAEEYEQIFKEGWRYMRDFLYVENVHGAPWEQVYEWYAPWIKSVKHRTDLNYVVDILSGEVAIGHSYVRGGDMPDVDRVPIGLLGADYEINNGRYQIAKIYRGDTYDPNNNGPLSMPGMNVSEGDYIISINGESLTDETNIHYLMEQTAGQTVRLEVSDNASGAGSRVVLVKPVSSEYNLRNIEWINGNIQKVDEMSDGKLAYVYLPNTGGGGFNSFNRYFFAQQNKKGVILDERNNGGGSAADYMIDVMNRKLFGYFNSKAGDKRPWTTPMAALWGPKVMIINERAGSGGDLLPYMFKEAGIGPLVGTRTWGGLVGTWDTPRFIDGGRMVAPRGGFFDKNGEWAVEGEGIAPDIEVIQTPKEQLEGRDPQLERAVEEALKLLEEEEFQLKEEPAPPVRWKRPAGWEREVSGSN